MVFNVRLQNQKVISNWLNIVFLDDTKPRGCGWGAIVNATVALDCELAAF